MRGFLAVTFQQSGSANSTATEFYSRAIEILKWGQRSLKAVPRKQKGAIFDPTFLIGVRSLYLNALLDVGNSFVITVT